VTIDLVPTLKYRLVGDSVPVVGALYCRTACGMVLMEFVELLAH
jgi:hypothetical protein